LTEEQDISKTVNIEIDDVVSPALCSGLIETGRPSSETSGSTFTNVATSRGRSKKRKLASADSIDQAISEVDAEHSSSSNNDKARHYGMAVAVKLRRLKPYQMAVARRDIELALFNVEYSFQAGDSKITKKYVNNLEKLPALWDNCNFILTRKPGKGLGPTWQRSKNRMNSFRLFTKHTLQRLFDLNLYSLHLE